MTTKADKTFEKAIKLPNDVQTIPQLNEFVDTVCEAAMLDMATTMSMNLALEEAVVNVMNYAYAEGTKGFVDIEAQIIGKQLRFVISDSGVPFDPTAQADADTTLTAEERGIGGLGIHLIRQLMDHIQYERANDRNVFTLIKNLS